MRMSDWSSDVCSSDLAVVFIRPGQEQRAGQVGADAKISVAHGTDRIVDMGAESLPRAIAVEQRRENLERQGRRDRSEEHTSELQSLMRISYAVFCLKKKKQNELLYNKHKITYT